MYFEANIAENGNFIVIELHVCDLFGENPLAREVTLYLFKTVAKRYICFRTGNSNSRKTQS